MYYLDKYHKLYITENVAKLHAQYDIFYIKFHK